MPLYEYECTACHRRTEKIQKFSDPELTVCPYCAGPLERTITAAAFSFAGGGWYKDGYGSAKPAAPGGEAAAAPAASGDKTTTAATVATSDSSAAPAKPATPTATPAAASTSAKP